MAYAREQASRPWLAGLHTLDRAAALRWIKEVGELRFLRIATAAKGRGRGRPAASYPEGVRRALFLWVTGQASYEDAPGKAAQQIVSAKDFEDGRMVTIDHLQRRLRDGMMNALPSLVEQIERDALARGYDTIKSARFRALQQAMGPRHMSTDDRGVIADPHPRRTVQLAIDLARLERTRRLAAFARAFEDLVPADTPVSQLAALYDDTHRAIAELIKPQS